MIVGVDTGGTFTDFVFYDDNGIRVFKVPSTPHDPSLAIEDALQKAAIAAGFSLIHGTTVATNALLERKGAQTALITSQGCRDVLEIARQTRAELYSLSPTSRAPLIPPELRYEVPERLDFEGEVLIPLDDEALERVLDLIQAEGAESVAVCFLFSFLNSEHELEAGRKARDRGLFVSLSHEIAPEYREYERTSTVCANAYVAPVMATYLKKLSERARSSGASNLSIMQSNGGTLRAEEAAHSAVKTMLSGPAGGVIAATRVAQEAEFRRILTFDMGGTSTDVALVDGDPVTKRTGEVAGMPLLTPMLDIHTVGAGGGSIARIDAGGAIRVGPESAGADPGPVAYGKGDRLTVTDANILLGRLPSDTRLAGSLPLDRPRVESAFQRFSPELSLIPEQAAEGILAVVNAQMARALRHISVERGHDPSDYTLVAFGGAGPLHACALAESLRIPRVLVPRFPGAFSALGLALADVRREYARSIFASDDRQHDSSIASAIEALQNLARAELRQEGVKSSNIQLLSFVEARYVGQSYALRVAFNRSLKSVASAFHRAHRARYGHSDSGHPVEIVTAGLTAIGRNRRPLPRPDIPSELGRPSGAAKLWTESAYHNVPLYIRASIANAQVIPGPAIITQIDATTYVPPVWQAQSDDTGNLILQLTNPR